MNTKTRLLNSILSCIAALAAVLLLLLALSTRATVAQGPTILYVDADVTGGIPDGLSWTTAFTNLQDALAVANVYSTTNYEIWVAEGVYYPDQGAGTIADSPTMSFALRYNNVQLYGGFDPGAGADTWGERDWDLYPTVLSGDIAQDDTTDDDGVVVTATHIVTPNAYHVLYLDGVNAGEITTATVLDGLIVTAGQAQGSSPDDAGGGLYCDGSGSGHACSPALSNLTFAGNQADYGGGMVNIGDAGGTSSPVLANVTFAGNWAMYGGGMVNSSDGGTSSPALANVTFSGNRAGWSGGGMANWANSGTSSPALANVTLSGNWAGEYGGGMANEGSSGGTSSPVLVDVIFSGNQAGRYGGGMINIGDGGTSSPVLTGVTFIDNDAGSDGGGMVNSSNDGGTCSPALANVTFSGNQADWHGGGMYNEGFSGGTSSPALANVTFSGNRAGWSGGGMANYGTDGGTSSGTSSPTLTGVTFSGNSAGQYGGGMANEGSSGGTSSPTLANAVVWGNDALTGTQIYNDNATPRMSYSLVQGGIGGSGIYNDGVATVIDGGGNIDADPQFVYPITATLAPTTTGDYRLLGTSPAIDVGNNLSVTVSTDLDGSPRLVDGDYDGAATVDMGAYEYQRIYIYLPLVIRSN